MGAISTAAAWGEEVEGGRGKNFPLMQKFLPKRKKWRIGRKALVESTEEKADIARLSPRIFLSNLPKYRGKQRVYRFFFKSDQTCLKHRTRQKNVSDKNMFLAFSIRHLIYGVMLNH